MSADRSAIDRLQETLFQVLVANWLVFFFVAALFDGGAFPWGEIRMGQYFVGANQTEAEVPGWWFWLTFWHGAAVWIGLGVFAAFFSWFEARRRVMAKEWKAAVNMGGVALFGVVWACFMINVAIQIGS